MSDQPAERDTGIEPNHAHDFGHVMPMKILVGVFVTLVFFTVLTVVVARIDLGQFNLYVALAVAGIKATLVVLFFMHLLYDRPFNAVIFVGCLIFVTLFLSFALTDSGAYRHTVIPGEAVGMRDIHTPMGSGAPVGAPAAQLPATK